MSIFSVVDDLSDFIKSWKAAKTYTPPKGQPLPFSGKIPAQPATTAFFTQPPAPPPQAPPLKSQPQPKPFVPPPGGEQFAKDWKKSGSVGGHSQPTEKQVTDYTKAYEDTGKTPSQLALEQASTKPPASAVYKKPPEPSKPPSQYIPPDWTQTGGQLGSNKGGTFADPSGQEWYVKQPKTEELSRNELLTNALYRAAGVDVPEMTQLGPNVIGSKIIDAPTWKSLGDKVPPAAIKEMRKNFAIDVWLNNWDVAGTGFDNLLVGKDGKVYRIDQGGGLGYRAQGEAKHGRGLLINSDAIEFNSMRGLPYYDRYGHLRQPQKGETAKIFGGLKDDSPEMLEGIKRLQSIKPDQVAAIVQQYGPKDAIAQKNLTKLLLRRRDNIVQRALKKETKGLEKIPHGERVKKFGKEVLHSLHGLGGPITQSHLAVTTEGGFWTTPSEKLANLYAGLSPGAKGTRFSWATKQGQIAEFVNSVEDYLRYDAKGAHYSSVNSKVIKRAREGYYPGIIVDNVGDEPAGGHSILGKPQTVVITLDPVTQRLKEAKFDPAKASLNDLVASGAGFILPPAIAAAVGMGAGKAQAAEGDMADEGPMREVDVKGLGTLRFPDSLPDAAVEKAIKFQLSLKQQQARLGPGDKESAQAIYGAEQTAKEMGVPDIQRMPTGTERAKGLLKEGYEQIKTGAGKLGGEADMGEGVQRHGKPVGIRIRPGPGDIVEGVGTATSAPFGLVSPTVEQKTGIPMGVTEAVLGFGLPFSKAGLAKMASGLSAASTASKTQYFGKQLLREANAWAARETAKTASMLEPFYKEVNRMGPSGNLAVMAHLEGVSSGAPPLASPKAQALADQLRTEFRKRRTTLENLPATDQAHFIEDYFPHQWEDPAKATQFAAGWSAKQGSGHSLKKRSIPTIADGLAAGLKLKNPDVIASAMDYVTNMDKFIVHTQALEEGKGVGFVKYHKPGSKAVPPDWVPLEGRFGQKFTPAGMMRPYAPKEFARIWNNFVSKGAHGLTSTVFGKRPGDVYDAALKTVNATTALELSLSAYHGIVMANEAYQSGIALGMRELVGGAKRLDPKLMLRGVANVATAPLRPVTTALSGHSLQSAFLGLSPGTAKEQEVAELLMKAGGRAVGYQHDKSYQFSAMNSYWQSWKRGALQMELAHDFARAKTGVLPAGAVVAKQIGRALTTVSQPLFEKYIPKLKTGAFKEMMSSWLAMNPAATQEQKVAEATRIWDSVDNRFGEMVHDNIFWAKGLKQSLMLGMRSFSWNMGTAREIGLGAKDILHNPAEKIGGTKDISSRTAYVIGMPIGVGMLNIAYQYLLGSGDGPNGVEDFIAGRTGGTVPGVSVPSLRPFGRSTQSKVSERVMVPGYQKDVFGWYEDWQGEVYKKLATLPRAMWEVALNRDWKNDPIINPEATAPEWLKQYGQYVEKNFGPISARSIAGGQKVGSNLGETETALGFRPAPGYLQDPRGYAEAHRRRNLAAWKRKTAIEKKQQRQTQPYGGPREGQ